MTNINEDKPDLVKATKSILGISDDQLEVFPKAPRKGIPYEKPTMRQFVTTIYFTAVDYDEARVAGELAAERIEQFSPDCKISDVKTEEIDNGSED